PRGSTSISDLSSDVEEAVERGWVFATLMFGEAQVRTGYLMVGVLRLRHLRNTLLGVSKEFEKIKPEALVEKFAEVVAGSPEDGQSASDGFHMGGAAPGEASGAMGPAQMGKQEALRQFTVDLTEQARSGKIDPIVGRDEEIRQVVDILMRRHQNVPFSLINRLLRKKEITEVIDIVYRHCGQKQTVIFCDHIMALGFRFSARAGISFGKDDLIIPKSKENMVKKTETQVKEFEQQYQDGLITQGEKYNKVVDAWSHCTEEVAEAMMKEIQKQEAGRPVNSVYMMAHSGARGSAAQMKQLAGMRGLMAKPSGEIIETPIISNFKEGLNVLEYFNSTHG